MNILFKTPIADRWRDAAKLIGIDILTMRRSGARVMSGTLLAFDFGTKASASPWVNGSPAPPARSRR